jgi:hypothetical protein
MRLNDLEILVLQHLLAGDDPVLAALRGQVDSVVVKSRDWSGAGFMTAFSVLESAPQARANLRAYIGDVYADINGLRDGAGFILFIEDGRLNFLEGFSPSEWGEPLPLKRLYCVHPKNPGEAQLVETISRDFSYCCPWRAG